MTSIKVKGIVEEEKGSDSCRIKVIAFKKNGEYARNKAEIKDLFPPYGYVFAPSFFKKTEYPIYSFIEFWARPNDRTKSENDDEYLLDINKDLRLTGYPLYELPAKALTNERALDQMYISMHLATDSSKLYISIGQYLYGPLKTTGNGIVPASGTEVDKYALDLTNRLTVKDRTYLLSAPNESICKIDCMTPVQLGEWIKPFLNASAKIDIPTLKKALDVQREADLDNARLQRAFDHLTHLELQLENLKKFSQLSPGYTAQFGLAMDKVRDEIEKELVTPYEEQKQALESDIARLTLERNRLKKEGQTLTASNLALKEDASFLATEKDRLIKDIRTQSLVAGTTGYGHLKTFEEQDYTGEIEAYLQLADFVDLIKASAEAAGKEDYLIYLLSILYQLKKHRCFLTDDLRVPKYLAQLTNNAKVFVQQAEVDWIKFESFFKSGLGEAWTSANNQPGTIHFFLLQDLNISSIECYARPLLDLLINIRQKLPGTDTGWPRNFWLFASPVQSKNAEGDSLGLPLSSSVFRHWAGTMKGVFEPSVKTPDLKKRLPLELVFEHSEKAPNEIKLYFKGI
ncbi:MAG: hypothetical protein Q8927_17165 [Bacteroidota bacterium]|nr:hypothetical protein [Bacteroidota bacterium]